MGRPGYCFQRLPCLAAIVPRMTTSQPNGLAPATVCHSEMHKHVLKLRAQGPILRRGWQAQERQYTMLQIMSTNVSEEDKVTRVCVVLANSGKAPEHSFVVATEISEHRVRCDAGWAGPHPTMDWCCVCSKKRETPITRSLCASIRTRQRTLRSSGCILRRGRRNDVQCSQGHSSIRGFGTPGRRFELSGVYLLCPLPEWSLSVNLTTAILRARHISTRSALEPKSYYIKAIQAKWVPCSSAMHIPSDLPDNASNNDPGSQGTMKFVSSGRDALVSLFVQHVLLPLVQTTGGGGGQG